jgi:hypothetical protein
LQKSKIFNKPEGLTKDNKINEKNINPDILNKYLDPKNDYVFNINSYFNEKKGYSKLNNIYASLYSPIKSNNSVSIAQKKSNNLNTNRAEILKNLNLKIRSSYLKKQKKKIKLLKKLKQLKNKKMFKFNNKFKFKILNKKLFTRKKNKKLFSRKKKLQALQFPFFSNKNRKVILKRLYLKNNLKKSHNRILGTFNIQTFNSSLRTENLKNNWVYWVNSNLRKNSTRRDFKNKI